MMRRAWPATSSSCVTMMIVRPPAFKCSKRAMISSLVWESRFPVGSSASRTAGSLTSARAIATRCCWPPESSLGLWSMRSPSPTSRELPGRPRVARARSDPGVEQRQGDVLERAGARQQVEALEHEAELLEPDRRELVVAERRDVVAVEEVPARRRTVEAAQQVHQRRLAGSRRPHDRDVLAGRDGEADAAQRFDLDVAERTSW